MSSKTHVKLKSAVHDFTPPEPVEELARAKLKSSGINVTQAAALGITWHTAAEAASFGVPGRACLRFEYFKPDGSRTPMAERFHRVRYLGNFGDLPKYMQPKGSGVHAYFPHAPGLDWPAIVADPARELCITEGELKAAAASLAGFPTVGLSGVDCFGSRRAGVGFLPELAAINYSGRKVVVAYDSDITDKPEVQQALKRLAIQLAARGALVHVVTLPPGPDGAKVGLDDFLLAHTAADLRALLDAAGLYVSELDQIVGRFNERYMVVKDGGRALVFEDVLDERRGHRKFDPMKFQDLENLYANTRVQVGAYQNGAPIFKTHAEAWLAHPLRRQFIRGVVFDPTGAERDGVLNLWRGFAVAPAPGDWSRLRWHIRNVICNGDAARSDYLLGWLARLVQHPAEPGQVAVVARTNQLASWYE